jgi:hypothetical protein
MRIRSFRETTTTRLPSTSTSTARLRRSGKRGSVLLGAEDV